MFSFVYKLFFIYKVVSSICFISFICFVLYVSFHLHVSFHCEDFVSFEKLNYFFFFLSFSHGTGYDV